jgi:1-aminocyclopropane-1-carboxylate deaminase/D-cysteine desulfhydrase-like pyridoxal-dependent ACC family enzyme
MKNMRWKASKNADVKRLDLLHPIVSGNKFFKLKYNIEQAKHLGVERIVTFGGAYSNHLHAAAWACKENNLQLIALILLLSSLERLTYSRLLSSRQIFPQSCH